MPVTTTPPYAEQSGDPDHFTHVLDHLFIPALESLGYQVIPPSVTGSELIHAEIIKNLEQADLVLCDLSSLNPNVFFELGIRTALDRPVVLVKDKLTSQVPFDLNALNVFTYDGSLRLWTVKDEVPRLTAHVAASIKSAPDAGNAMWRYFGLTKRASPAEITDPTDAKLSLILSELTKLGQTGAREPFDPLALASRITGSDDLDMLYGTDAKTILQTAYRDGLSFGRKIYREADLRLLDDLLAKNPRMPYHLEARLMQASTLEPDLPLRNFDVRSELRRGFWDGFGEGYGGDLKRE